MLVLYVLRLLSRTGVLLLTCSDLRDQRLVEQRSDTSSRLWSDCFLCAELHIFPADSSLKIAANQEPSHFNKWIHLFFNNLVHGRD